LLPTRRRHGAWLENFWSLLKRCFDGTYMSVEPLHLFRYLEEEAFLFNERDGEDADRFKKALESVAACLVILLPLFTEMLKRGVLGNLTSYIENS